MHRGTHNIFTRNTLAHIQCTYTHTRTHMYAHTYTLSCRVGRLKEQMAEICVKAVLAVADLARKDVNLDLIKVCVCVCVCASNLLYK